MEALDKRIESYVELTDKITRNITLSSTEQELMSKLGLYFTQIQMLYNQLKDKENGMGVNEEEKKLINEYKMIIEKLFSKELERKSIEKLRDCIINMSNANMPAVGRMRLKMILKSAWNKIELFIKEDFDEKLNGYFELIRKNRDTKLSKEEDKRILEFFSYFETVIEIYNVLITKEKTVGLDEEEKVIVAKCADVARKQFQLEVSQTPTDRLNTYSNVLKGNNISPAMRTIKLECVLNELARRENKESSVIYNEIGKIR